MVVLLHIFCSTFPARLMAYVPFFDRLRFGKGAVFGTLASALTLELLLAGLAIWSGHPEWVRTIEYCFGLVGIAACWLNIRLAPSKLLFAYLLVVDYLMIVTGTAAYLAVVALGTDARSWQSSVLCLVLYALTFPMVLSLYRRTARRTYETDAPALWRQIWLVPFLNTATVMIFTGSLESNLVASWKFLFARVGLLLCVLVIYWVLVHSLENLQKLTAAQEQAAFEAHLMEMQMEEQKKQSLLIMENAQITRQMRHDLRHQLVAIQAMAGDENPKLTAYIASLIQNIPSAVQEYCENPIVNAVVSHYASICQGEEISFSARLVIPAQNPSMTDSSLCVILGNLLENAVEACGRMRDGEKFISLNSRVEHGVLTIAMDNSFDGTISQQNGKFRSSKRSGAGIGIGLSSVQAVAKAHQGDARFEAEGTVFHSLVYGTL